MRRIFAMVIGLRSSTQSRNSRQRYKVGRTVGKTKPAATTPMIADANRGGSSRGRKSCWSTVPLLSSSPYLKTLRRMVPDDTAAGEKGRRRSSPRSRLMYHLPSAEQRLVPAFVHLASSTAASSAVAVPLDQGRCRRRRSWRRTSLTESTGSGVVAQHAGKRGGKGKEASWPPPPCGRRWFRSPGCRCDWRTCCRHPSGEAALLDDPGVEGTTSGVGSIDVAGRGRLAVRGGGDADAVGVGSRRSNRWSCRRRAAGCPGGPPVFQAGGFGVVASCGPRRSARRARRLGRSRRSPRRPVPGGVSAQAMLSSERGGRGAPSPVRLRRGGRFRSNVRVRVAQRAAGLS